MTFVVLLGKLSMVVSPEIMACWTFKDAFGGLPRRRGTRRWRFPLVMHDNLEDEMLEFVAKLYVGSLVDKK